MPATNIKVKHKNKNRLNSILAKAKQSPDVVLAVGFPGNLVGGIQYPKGKKDKGAAPRVIDVAAQNEFGSDGPPKIPARPFMKQSSKDVKAFLHNKYKKKNFMLAGGNVNKKQARKFIVVIAPEIEAIYDLKIVNLTEPINAPLTIKLKGSSNPLIDTGLMRQTLTYDIRTKKQ